MDSRSRDRDRDRWNADEERGCGQGFDVTSAARPLVTASGPMLGNHWL